MQLQATAGVGIACATSFPPNLLGFKVRQPVRLSHSNQCDSKSDSTFDAMHQPTVSVLL